MEKRRKMKPGPWYHIEGLCPRTDISLGRCGFIIQLFQPWKDAVAASKLNQEMIHAMIKNMHRSWLDGCGFDQIYDPEEDPLDRWKSEKLSKPRKLSKAARPFYDEHSIQVRWGEWGPEHITVPGNACGLDIDDYVRQKILAPHNIDNTNQVILLLTIFTCIGSYLIEGADLK
jgi:hypothetical protein